jgi:hypothetical protein
LFICSEKKYKNIRQLHSTDRADISDTRPAIHENEVIVFLPLRAPAFKPFIEAVLFIHICPVNALDSIDVGLIAKTGSYQIQAS